MAKKGVPFPTKAEVAAFVRGAEGTLTRREIARAFHITGDDRIQLKALMRELEDEGVLARRRGHRMAPSGALPEVCVLDVIGPDADGEVLARPNRWAGPGDPPAIFMAPERRGHPALGGGDRVLARLRRLADGSYEGRTIKRLAVEAAQRVVGVFSARPGGGIVLPADRRQKDTWFVAEAHRRGARDGELVVAEIEGGAGFGPRPVAIVDRLGDAAHPRSISLIAIHTAGIPTEFPPEAIAEAERAVPATIAGRADLRSLPLVTIDGADARDFDDAVWAEPEQGGADPGGWHLIVAIADVAHHVPAGSALDREAHRRGNSSYFPDRVVPMLPEALSNGLCSLKPGEDRACLAAHLWIDAAGRIRRHRFERALMRSAARLTYEDVEAARRGRPTPALEPLFGPVVAPLYGAFAALLKARVKRGTLDLDLPERTIVLDAAGSVERIGVRERLDSHRLIEEFMIAANVAAAQTLEEHGFACLFRIHDAPDPAKIAALSDFLAPLGYRIAKGQVLRPRAFTQILARARGRPEAEVVNEMVLRSQAQAVYAPENIGHFGLALPRYAHFTSPIRRYADLTLHRGLVRLLGLGEGGAPDAELLRLGEIGQHVSMTERRSAGAERDAVDRYVASWLARRIGREFPARITGVTRFGLFATLPDSGADGLIPISTLPDDHYDHDSLQHALVGRRWGRVFRLGAAIAVRVVEADAITGSTVFHLVGGEEGAEVPWLLPAAGLPRGPGRRPARGEGAAAGRRRTRR